MLFVNINVLHVNIDNSHINIIELHVDITIACHDKYIGSWEKLDFACKKSDLGNMVACFCHPPPKQDELK